MVSIDDVRGRGEAAIAAVRNSLNERAASLIQMHPEFAQGAAEVGLVNRAWLEDPTGNPIRTATSRDVVQRFLERSIEREPSLIAALGLNVIQMLSIEADNMIEGDRPIPMSIMFTDLEGFTAFTSKEGDEAARRYLERHHKLVGPVIRSRGGRIVKKLGDGLLISFNAPEGALLAALEMVDAHDDDLRLRAGIHQGEAVLLGNDLVGNDVNIAARVTDIAKGGEVLATTDVREAVGSLPAVKFGRARRKSFKGVEETVMVCRVARA